MTLKNTAVRRPAQPGEVPDSPEHEAADLAALEAALAERPMPAETPQGAVQGVDPEARTRRIAALNAELAALGAAPHRPPPNARVVQLDNSHVRVRCISESKPWGEVQGETDEKGNSPNLRPLMIDEEVVLVRPLAERMQKNRHVVILGN